MSRRQLTRIGKMPTTSVRRRMSLFRRSFGLLLQMAGEHGEREGVGPGGFQMVPDLVQAQTLHALEHQVEPGVDRRSIALLVDRVEHRLDERPLPSRG
jgi:hypothetical protein